MTAINSGAKHKTSTSRDEQRQTDFEEWDLEPVNCNSDSPDGCGFGLRSTTVVAVQGGPTVFLAQGTR